MSPRRVIRGEGIPEHPQPFPPAVQIGNMVFTAAIGGQDVSTGKLPEGVEAQSRNAFRHLQTILRMAGATLEDVAKVTVYLTDRGHREAFNPVWVEHFPKADDRPVRHTAVGPLAGGMLVQIEVIAVKAVS